MKKRTVIPRVILGSTLALSLSVLSLEASAAEDTGPGRQPTLSPSSSATRAPVVAPDGSRIPRPQKLTVSSADAPVNNANSRGYKEVYDYWTPQRLANAKPAPMPTPSEASDKSSTSPTSGTQSNGTSQSSGVSDQSGNASASKGKSQTSKLIDPRRKSQTSKLIDPRRKSQSDSLKSIKPARVLSKPIAPANAPQGTVKNGGTVQQGGSSVQGNVAPAASSKPATGATRTNGKVFFRKSDGNDYMCSGSVVGSKSHNTVITAGHCVYEGPNKGWHSNWVFIPDYNHGSRPYGTFQARIMRTYNDWIQNGPSGKGFNSDVAFVNTFNNEKGQKLTDTVGGHGIVTGGSYGFDATVYGYPGNIDNGESMQVCTGRTGTRTIGFFTRWYFHNIEGCNFGGGASGGPWLQDHDSASGLGYVRSVTSFKPAKGAPVYIGGSYFDNRMGSLYEKANND